MSRKRGLSVDEKRTKMMELFYEKKDFFQLKELEKSCQKEKGITSMSVKEILTSLVDDGMVDTDKIGTSVYFWAFPSKASQNRKRKIAELNETITATKNKLDATQALIKEATVGRINNAQREAVLRDLSNEQHEKDRVKSDLERYRECDPEVVDGIRQEVIVAKEATNRWTDNIFSTKSWIKNKFSFEESIINKQFGIPEDFDYLE